MNGFCVSTDKGRLDRDVVFAFLHACYWAAGRTRAVFERSVDQSLCFGLFDEESGRQAGFARVVTDRATFAYLCDVFVLAPYRGRGLGVFLMQSVVAHPDLQGLRRFLLATRDAHGLYEKVGFARLASAERFMVIGAH